MSPKSKKKQEAVIEEKEAEAPAILPTSDDPPVPVDPEVLAWEAEHFPEPPPE